MQPSRDDRNRRSTARGKWPAGRPTSRPGRIAIASLMMLAVSTARADDRPANPDGVDFFESKVRPVLVEHCYKCHSAQAKSPKGSLRLDSLDAMRKGGDTGPAVVPGDVEASLLVQAVRYKDDETCACRRRGSSPTPTIAALEQWVEAGPSMPHGVEATADPAARKPAGIDFEAARIALGLSADPQAARSPR